MPDSGEHQAGAFLFNTVYWLLSPANRDLGLLILSSAAALLGGATPDALEPPTWAGHRGDWHYIGGLLSALPSLALWQSEGIGFLIGAYCVGYFSHFVLDVTT